MLRAAIAGLLLLVAVSAQAQTITALCSSSAKNQDGNNPSVTAFVITMCDRTAGDVYFAELTMANSAIVLNAPTGWIQIGSPTSNRSYIYYHVAGAGEPTTYTWTLQGLANTSGGMIALSGVNNINPIDVFAQQSTTATTCTVPAVTTTKNNDFLIASCGLYTSVVSIGAWSGGLISDWATPLVGGVNYGSAAAHIAGPAIAGVTSSYTLALGGSVLSDGWLVAFAPATPSVSIVQKQQVSNNCSGTVGSTTPMPAITVAGGDLLVLSCNSSWGSVSGTATISTVTDNQSNYWNRVINLDKSSVGPYNADPEIWYETNARPGSTTVTVTQGGTATGFTLDCNLSEYSGFTTGFFVDKTASNFAAAGIGTPGIVGPTGITLSSNEVAITAYGSGSGLGSALSALGGTVGTWTKLTTGGCGLSGNNLLPVAGSVGTSVTFTGADSFAAVVAVFANTPPSAGGASGGGAGTIMGDPIGGIRYH